MKTWWKMGCLLILFFNTSAYAQYDTRYFNEKIIQLKSHGPEVPNALHANKNDLGATNANIDPDKQQAVFNEILGSCKATLDTFSTNANAKVSRAENWSLFGAAAGLLGSVLSGHASTIAVGLLSGSAGVANTVQQTYKDNGDTPEAILANRSQIFQNAISAANEFSGSQDISVRQAALEKLHVACTLYDITIPKTLPSPTTPQTKS
jgi:hypothetical protein